MKRLAAACLLTMLLVAPAAAQESETPNPLDVLLDAFESPEGQEFTARFLREPSGAASLVDPFGDFEHSSGESPGFRPGHVDILSTWALELDPGPVGLFDATDADQIWAPTGPREISPPSYDPFHTFTGDQIHDGSQYEGGALLFGFTLVDTPPAAPPGRCEYVVWVNDLSRDQAFVRNPSFPLDPAGDTNLAFGLGLNPEGGPGLQSAFALELQEAGGFTPVFEADVRAFITPRYVGITVPKELTGEIGAVNFYAFCAEEDITFDPSLTGADQTGLVDFIPEELGSVVFESVEVAVSTTTTEPTTTSTTAETTTTSLVVDSEPEETETSFPWWFVLIFGGAGLALVGWWLYSREDDPCKELLEIWMSAEEACREARVKADEAADECEKAELELAGLEDERKEVCRTWPPVCWDTEEGDWIEDERGNRITSRDIHMRRVALGDVWDQYRAGKLSASEVEARWREMDTPEFRRELRDTDAAFKDVLDAIDADIAKAEEQLDEACVTAERAAASAEKACQGAEEARRAYEECVGEAVGDKVEEAQVHRRTPDPATTFSSGPAGPGHAGDPCDGGEGKREVRKAGDPERTLVFVYFSIITGVSEGSERNVAAGSRLAIDLNDLANELGFAGDLLGARSAGLHIGGAVNGYAKGKYTVTAAGLVKGGVDAAMATDALPEVPTTPLQAGLEGLETLARLGNVVASKVTEWMTNVQIMTVRLTMFYQDITATPYEMWECSSDGEWVCVQKIWEVEVSGLKRLLGQDRSFTVNSDIRRREFERVIRGLAHRASTTIRRDAESLARWRTEHEPGPCR